ncbi:MULTISPECIES: CatB-related O-acetyltransferase [Dysgonomonas]|jgi:acetyltransferase-like isoleucine patch superfamily enzyme|uniref:CatB-related O-acetyltransferase n=1 Tax=Dysgonomonas termitidis TaxID=1516126 RepID=A0ABV9KYR9_9BACT|nr:MULTISPECIES: CatB-related O-acetyltransferase [unclassified Dysgonomonas]MDR2003711.1 CatB-related O-acetyltransferase [Prevotella sp.]HMM01549.1 CatB-related O-acetyltransferase [Dysgonomonas sp.]
MIEKIYNRLKIFRNNRKWRLLNRHNFTTLNSLCSTELIQVGRETYGNLTVSSWGVANEGLKIGSYCSIADEVKFILGGNHRLDTFSTYPFKVKKFNIQDAEAISKGPIIIEDDVWIGLYTIILSGVKIGKGSVIGAGSVVAKDIPPYSIAVGNPVRVLRKRFRDEVIEFLLQQDFNSIDFNKVKIDDLYKSISTVEDIKETILK